MSVRRPIMISLGIFSIIAAIYLVASGISGCAARKPQPQSSEKTVDETVYPTDGFATGGPESETALAQKSVTPPPTPPPANTFTLQPSPLKMTKHMMPPTAPAAPPSVDPSMMMMMMMMMMGGGPAGAMPGAMPEGTLSRTDKSREAQLLGMQADELWVIVKPEGQKQAREEQPGTGALMAVVPGENPVPLPLKHTEVTAEVAGYIATVNVTQQFQNPFSEKIEASYVFPLPDNAAVNDFLMVIGERKIRGIIREREEAEKIYQAARAQGYVASLLTQERPNIFTQKVANIEPGKQIDVTIHYFNTLAYADGWYEFVFPMVVGPRFNPPGNTDGIGAAAPGKPGASGQKTEVPYLAPGERSGHDIGLACRIDAGVKIEEIACRSHVIEKQQESPEAVQVKLSARDSIPNKDFVLRFRVAGARVKSSVLTQRDERGGYFTLMLYPPESLKSLERSPMEMIFVLDCSGSMSGQPIAIAKDAVRRALRQLQANDTFQIINFSNNARKLGRDPVLATPANIRKGLAYLDSLNSEGGTMMIEGIKAALDFAHDPSRLRLVTFLTDGYIGNELEILGAIHDQLGASRIFSFGVGSSVNRFLLDRMAAIGKGAVAYIGLNDSAADVVDAFYQRISYPALTDLRIDWGGMNVADIYPRVLPDLFVGRAVIVTGRYQGAGSTTLRISGRAAGQEQTLELSANLDGATDASAGIASVWARKKIEDLSNQMAHVASVELPDEIRRTALDYNLMSNFTAFVAVDSLTRTQGASGVSVAVPVPVPEGVRYEITVPE